MQLYDVSPYSHACDAAHCCTTPPPALWAALLRVVNTCFFHVIVFFFSFFFSSQVLKGVSDEVVSPGRDAFAADPRFTLSHSTVVKVTPTPFP